MFGVQNVPPELPALEKARPSRPIVPPIALNSVRLNDCAVVIAMGNDVAPGVGGVKLVPGESPTPCSASDHTYGARMWMEWWRGT